MATAVLDLQVARGETVIYTGTHQTSASNTTPIDITGWTIKVTAIDWQGRFMLSKTATITTGASGLYTWTVTHGDTLVPPGRYALDIQRTDGGAEKLLAIGTWTVIATALYQSS